VNFDGTGIAGVGQTKVNAQIILRKIAAAAQHVPTLAHSGGIQIHSSSNGVTRAAGGTHKFQLNPMMMIGVRVAQQDRNADHIINDHAEAITFNVSTSVSTPSNNGIARQFK
jgi:hypothetical protein